jgi:hypothetical protein
MIDRTAVRGEVVGFADSLRPNDKPIENHTNLSKLKKDYFSFLKSKPEGIQNYCTQYSMVASTFRQHPDVVIGFLEKICQLIKETQNDEKYVLIIIAALLSYLENYA